jgi:hypothetical protein
MRAAWAYIHQPSNAEKYTEAEVPTIKLRIRQAAKDRALEVPHRDEFLKLMDRVRKTGE